MSETGAGGYVLVELECAVCGWVDVVEEGLGGFVVACLDVL